MSPRARNAWQWGIGIGILFPLFVQLDGGIYREADLMIDSQGMLTKLPLPISILTCLVALIFLAGSLGRARPALAMIFATVAVSLISLWLGGDGVTQPQRKLLMILQVILPLAGLLVGQLTGDNGKVIAKAFLVVLTIVIPVQLVATKLQGDHVLTHYLYALSIYSHRQFVTLIFVCAFAYSMTFLWDEYKFWLCVLMFLMFVYVTRSYSFLTIVAYGSFVGVFVLWKFWVYAKNSKRLLAPRILIVVFVMGGLAHFLKTDSLSGSNLFLGKFVDISAGIIPSNVQERFDDWKLFGNGIIESKKTFLVGHPEPMPREIRTSPHNWYLDIAYTFGVAALLPIFILGGYTARVCWSRRKSLPAQTWWLLAIVFFLVAIDSNFKVTLRQPYPGIFTFFMWGLLLSRLRPTAARQGA